MELTYNTFQKTDEIAPHILAFLFRSIVNPFKFRLANFTTSGGTESHLFPLF